MTDLPRQDIEWTEASVTAPAGVVQSLQDGADLPGAAERDAAISRTTESNDRWLAEVASTIHVLALSADEFTTDDVWRLLELRGVKPPPGWDPRAMGAAMQRSGSEGLIRPMERWIPTVRPVAHRSPKRVWRSLLRDHVAAVEQTTLALDANATDTESDASTFATSLNLLDRIHARADGLTRIDTADPIFDEIARFLRTLGRQT